MIVLFEIMEGADEEPLVQAVGKWLFRAYMLWSISADIILICGIAYLIFF